jgi:hypothetical protein
MKKFVKGTIREERRKKEAGQMDERVRKKMITHFLNDHFSDFTLVFPFFPSVFPFSSLFLAKNHCGRP